MGATLLLGAGGQLGSDLARMLGPAVVALGRPELDVIDATALARVVGDVGPALIVNCTAFNRVDDAETDPAPAFAVNAVAVHHLARLAARHGARLVHFSTDYVFGGAGPGPYTEESPQAPLNAYGVSKLAGEYAVRQAGPRHLVIRSAGLYGVAGSRAKGNFVETMLRLAGAGAPIRVVDDQVVAPTYTADLAEGVVRLLAADPPGGIYHLASGGACTWFEFARAIFELARLRPELTPTTTGAFGTRARRPANSVLRSVRLPALGLEPLRPWPEALRAYLRATGRLPV